MKSKLMRGLAGLSTGLNDLICNCVWGCRYSADFRSSSDAEFVLAQDLGLCDVCRLPRSRAGRDAACSGPNFDCGLGREGSRDGGCHVAVGVPDDGSTSLSLVFGALIAGIGLVGGILWLANPDRCVSDLKRSEKTIPNRIRRGPTREDFGVRMT